jgi:ATP-dependent HslUV protease ATP-binding subunit HslU
MEEVEDKAELAAEDRLIDLLLPPTPTAVATQEPGSNVIQLPAVTDSEEKPGDREQRTREKLRQQFREGKLDERVVELDVRDRNQPSFEVISNQGSEIDKIAGREGGHGPDVSREGVQRDILPIVEGTTVSTKYGTVSTDHILFIAAGAFHVSKPSDLIPELQGRFPIRVELNSLTVNDFIRILTEPKSSLVKQSTALLETEGLKLEFSKEAIAEMAQFAFRVNETTENIGARRLHTILERVLDEISFQAPDLFKSPRAEITEEGVVGEVHVSAPLTSGPQVPSPPLPVIERQTATGVEKVILVDPEYVRQQVASIVKDQDLSRYIL